MSGSVYQRKNKKTGKKEGNWSFTAELGRDPVTNKRKQETKGGFKRKSQAEAALVVFLSDMIQNKEFFENEIEINDYIEEWFEKFKNNPKRKTSTIDARRYQADKVIEYFSGVLLNDITDSIYIEFLKQLDSKYSYNTCKAIHSFAKIIFNDAKEENIIKENPLEKVSFSNYIEKSKPSIEDNDYDYDSDSSDEDDFDNGLPSYFEREELKQFLEATKDRGLLISAIFHILAYLGIRIGECCSLKWDDFRFDKKEIVIRRTLYSKNNNTREYKLLHTKTNNSYRTLKMSDDLIALMKQHRQEQDEIRLNSANWHPKGFVFTKVEGKYPGYPETPTQVRNYMRQILAKTDIKTKLTPHGLRHTYTSLLAPYVPLHEIMKQLGHKNAKTTEQIYLHITNERKYSISREFEKVINNSDIFDDE